jgi:uncharacterized FAD-dependent dehydrogenase
LFAEPLHREFVRALASFERKMRGFTGEEAILIGAETRTSSPLRIVRDEKMRAIGFADLYPCGEGAGYAGGIVSSALDGLKAAEEYLLALDS